MSIKVLYFASLAEKLGRAESSIPHQDSLTVKDVWNNETNHLPIPANLLAAVNMNYVEWSFTVQDGDEVAFFPPVTGG